MESFTTTTKIGRQSIGPRPFVIAIIDCGTRNKEAYAITNSYFDVSHGLLCTCVNLPRLEKAHKINPSCGLYRYASSLLSKILAKADIRLGYLQDSADKALV